MIGTKSVLLNKDLQEIDRVVIKGQVCNVTSVSSDGVWLIYPNSKNEVFRNIRFLKDNCSFIQGIFKV